MRLPSWLRSLVARPNRTPARRAPRRPTCRPRLEALEDRTVPSTVTWINPNGGDWDTAANWQDDLGVNRLPGSSDDVVIGYSGITVTHTSGQTESIHSLTSQANLSITTGELDLAAGGTVSGEFDNAGTVRVLGGTLALDGGGTSSGTFDAAGAGLVFGGAHTLTASSSVAAQDVDFELTYPIAVLGSITSVAGSYLATGSTTVNAGLGPVHFTGTVLGVGDSLYVAGLADFSPAAPTSLTVGALTLDYGATLAGTANFTVTGLLDWGSNTAVDGSGTLTSLGQMHLHAGASQSMVVARAVENDGAATWDGGVLTIGASFVNAAGASFTAADGAVRVDGGGLFDNEGQFADDAPYALAVQPAFDNAGTVRVLGGTLALDGGGTSSGTFDAAGAGLVFGGAHTLTASSSVAAQDVDFELTYPIAVLGSITSVAGSYLATGSTTVNAGLGPVHFTGTVLGVGDSLYVAGLADFSPAAPTSLTVGALTLDYGATLAGTANFTVTGLLDWGSNTAVDGSGTLTSLGQMNLHAGASQSMEVARAVENDGAATWDGGVLVVSSAGGSFRNAAGASFTAADGAVRVDGGGLFDNEGQFADAAPYGLALQPAFDNAGAVTVQSGTLALTGGYTQTSGATVLAGGTISSSAPLNIQGGTLTGAGTIQGSVFNAGEVDPGLESDPTGVITVQGDYEQTAAGSLAVDLSGPAPDTAYDQLAVTGGVTLGGSLVLRTQGGFTPAAGDTFTIVNNAGSAPINGVFAGLAEGATVWDVTHSFQFSISYVGGDGNDVTLNPVKATPTVSVTDAGGFYNGSAFPATGTVTGVSGTPGSTLEGVGLTFTYYAGNSASSPALSGAPSADGTYTVVAAFAGSADYTSASAQTTFTISPNTGILLLDPTGQSLKMSGNSVLNVSDEGAIYVDSSNAAAVTASGNASVVATEIDVKGGVSTSGNAVVKGVVNKGATPLADPLANLAAPAQPSTQFTAVNYSGTLQPGTYVGGITVSGNSTVTLSAGTYYLTGGGLTVSGNAKVSGTAVLIYITGLTGGNSISVNLSGNASVTLSPPTSGPYQGVVLFQNRTLNAAIDVSGNAALNTTGTEYAAAATVNLTGNDDTDNPTHTSLGSQWIVSDLVLSGNASFSITADANNRNENPNALMAAGGPATSMGPVDVLTQAQATSAVQEAIALWAAAGLDAGTLQALAQTRVVIAPLPSPYLGLAAPGVIYLDPTAAGYGWFTDASPTAVTPAGSIDLLTVVSHELGHEFGLMDGDGAALMPPTLAPGVRILPDASDLAAPHIALTVSPVAQASRLWATGETPVPRGAVASQPTSTSFPTTAGSGATLAAALLSFGEPVVFSGGGMDGVGGTTHGAADALAAFMPGGLAPAAGQHPFLDDLAGQLNASDGAAEWSAADLALLSPFDALLHEGRF